MGYNEPIRGTGNGNARAHSTTHRAAKPAAALGSPEIPDKLYFRIGDVARLCDVPAYVLRFWETEFAQLKPNKGGTGQRLYRRREVETALRIKQLLYDEGYTISGARQLLRTEHRQGPPQLSLIADAPAAAPNFKGLRRELESIVSMLSRPAGARPAPVPMRAPRRTTSARRDPDLAQGLFAPPADRTSN